MSDQRPPDMAALAAARESMNPSSSKGGTNSSANLPSAADSVFSEGQQRIGEGQEGLSSSVAGGGIKLMGNDGAGFDQILNTGGMNNIFPQTGPLGDNLLSAFEGNLSQASLGHNLGSGIMGSGDMQLQSVAASAHVKIQPPATPSQGSGNQASMG